MLSNVVPHYHTGHPSKKILFEPKSIGCIDKSIYFYETKYFADNVTIGHKRWLTYILLQKCIFPCPKTFLDDDSTILFADDGILFAAWDEWMRKKPGQFLFCYKKIFLWLTILFADDGTEPERPSHHHNRPLHYSVVRYFFTLKIQSEMEEAPRYRLFTQLTLLSLLSLLPLIPLLTLFNTLFK